MKPSHEKDLIDMTEIMEDFVLKFQKMTEADQIDLAARLKPVAKACKTIDDEVKLGIKTKLHNKEGSRLGNLFKAVLKIVPTDTFRQKEFKEDHPAKAAEYTDTVDQIRITFETR